MSIKEKVSKENAIEMAVQKIEEQWDEQVKFLAELGKHRSTLGNEASIQRYLAETFDEMGLETKSIIPDQKTLSEHPGYSPVEWTYDGRPVVVAKWASDGPKIGKSLILQGHIDVVSPEPTRLWDYDPWVPTIEGDRMYGRGICDMKAGVAAMTYAVKAIKDSGIELGADLLLESVHEEECTGNGALATLLDGHVADGVLIPEPSGLNALRVQQGVIWMRVRITGLGAHVASGNDKQTAINAIEKAYVLIKALQDYREIINKEEKHPAYENMENPLTVNIGTIQSGDWPSTVPADCSFEVRIGVYPGKDPQEVKNEVKAWLIEAASKDPWLSKVLPEITFFGFHAYGWELEQDNELFKVLEESHESIHNRKLEYSVNTALTDTRHYTQFFNIPATCYGPTGSHMHSANEWVSLQSVKDVAKTYVAFIINWCGIRNTEEV